MPPTSAFHSISGFNSMVVRLRHERKQRAVATGIQFQFYGSAIKTYPSQTVRAFARMFQFYGSAIKTVRSMICLNILRSFNSMVVRLRLSKDAIEATAKKRFNSMVVRLRLALATTGTIGVQVSILW